MRRMIVRNEPERVEMILPMTEHDYEEYGLMELTHSRINFAFEFRIRGKSVNLDPRIGSLVAYQVNNKNKMIGKTIPLTKCTKDTSFPDMEEVGFEEHRLEEALCI